MRRAPTVNRRVSASSRHRAGHYPAIDVTGQRRITGNASNVAQPRLRLNLYASGAIEAGVERESWRERSLAATELVTREDVTFGAAQAWFRLFRAVRARARTGIRNLDRHEKLVDDFAAIASIDQGRRYDLIQARSRTEQVRQAVVTGEAEIAAAREALGRFYPGPVELAKLEPPPELPPPGAMMDEAAVALHPQVEAARRQLLAAEANVRAARASRMPRIDLESRRRRQRLGGAGDLAGVRHRTRRRRGRRRRRADRRAGVGFRNRSCWCANVNRPPPSSG